MKTATVIKIFIFIATVTANHAQAARPSLQSLQAEVDSLNAQTADLQQQINSIPAVGEAKYEFVGFSTSTHTGGYGVLNFTKSCQQDYQGSRMCTSDELLNTVNVPSSIPSGRAWIRPSFDTTETCGNWESGSQAYYGVTVSDKGGLWGQRCDNLLPVACCAPAP